MPRDVGSEGPVDAGGRILQWAQGEDRAWRKLKTFWEPFCMSQIPVQCPSYPSATLRITVCVMGEGRLQGPAGVWGR